MTTNCIPSLSGLSEASAIANLKTGNCADFEVIYRMYKRRVYSLCWRMVGNRAIAEELTQETFMLVFRRITTFRGESAFTTWLHRLTVNVVLMYLRQQKSRGQEISYDDPEGTEDSRPSERYGAPDKVLVRSEERILLLRAISSLPQGYRIVFVLHDIEGYEHAEIAEMLGCSVGNTKSQLHKARMKMQQLLRGARRKRGQQSQPGVPCYSDLRGQVADAKRQYAPERICLTTPQTRTHQYRQHSR